MADAEMEDQSHASPQEYMDVDEETSSDTSVDTVTFSIDPSNIVIIAGYDGRLGELPWEYHHQQSHTPGLQQMLTPLQALWRHSRVLYSLFDGTQDYSSDHVAFDMFHDCRRMVLAEDPVDLMRLLDIIVRTPCRLSYPRHDPDAPLMLSPLMHLAIKYDVPHACALIFHHIACDWPTDPVAYLSWRADACRIRATWARLPGERLFGLRWWEVLPEPAAAIEFVTEFPDHYARWRRGVGEQREDEQQERRQRGEESDDLERSWPNLLAGLFYHLAFGVRAQLSSASMPGEVSDLKGKRRQDAEGFDEILHARVAPTIVREGPPARWDMLSAANWCRLQQVKKYVADVFKKAVTIGSEPNNVEREEGELSESENEGLFRVDTCCMPASTLVGSLNSSHEMQEIFRDRAHEARIAAALWATTTLTIDSDMDYDYDVIQVLNDWALAASHIGLCERCTHKLRTRIRALMQTVWDVCEACAEEGLYVNE